MRVVAINGSARRGGNTERLIAEAFRPLEDGGIECEMVSLAGMGMRGCRAVARRGGALNTLDTMANFFLLQDMFVAGSTYWPIAYGQMPMDVEQDEEGLATALHLGENTSLLLKALGELK